MKSGKKLKEIVFSATLIVGLIASIIANIQVIYADDFSEPKLQRVTCYTAPQGAVTASGKVVREGLCGAKRENIGKTAVVYRAECVSGNYVIREPIAILEIADTGSAKRIQYGSIDVFRTTLERCNEWIRAYGDYCFVQIIENVEG